MVNFASTITAIVGLVAIANASPVLHKRAVTCREDLGSSSYGRVSPCPLKRVQVRGKKPLTCSLTNQASEAVECINYLAGLGNQACVSSISGVNFCRRGNTQITGLSRNGNSATSSW